MCVRALVCLCLSLTKAGGPEYSPLVIKHCEARYTTSESETYSHLHNDFVIIITYYLPARYEPGLILHFIYAD